MTLLCTCAIKGPDTCPRHRAPATDWRWAHGVGPEPHAWQPHDPDYGGKDDSE